MEQTQTYSKLMEKKEQLKLLLGIVKENYTREETIEYFKQANELEAILLEDPTMDGLEIEFICNINNLSLRTKLFKYKGRGYIISDLNNNGRYKYNCTAEQLVYSLTPSEDFFLGNL